MTNEDLLKLYAYIPERFRGDAHWIVAVPVWSRAYLRALWRRLWGWWL